MALIYQFNKTLRHGTVPLLVETDSSLFIDSLAFDKDTLAQKFMQRAEFLRQSSQHVGSGPTGAGSLCTAGSSSHFEVLSNTEGWTTGLWNNSAFNNTGIYQSNLLRNGSHWMTDSSTADRAYVATPKMFYIVQPSTSQIIQTLDMGTLSASIANTAGNTTDSANLTLYTSNGSPYFSISAWANFNNYDYRGTPYWVGYNCYDTHLLAQTSNFVYYVNYLIGVDADPSTTPHSIQIGRYNKASGQLELVWRSNLNARNDATRDWYTKFFKHLFTSGNRLYFFTAGLNNQMKLRSFDLDTGAGFQLVTGVTSNTSLSDVTLTNHETASCSDYIPSLKCFYFPCWSSNTTQVLTLKQCLIDAAAGSPSATVTNCTTSLDTITYADKVQCLKSHVRVVPTLIHFSSNNQDYLILTRVVATRGSEVTNASFRSFNKLVVFQIDPDNSANLLFKADVDLGEQACYDVQFLAADKSLIATLHSNGVVKLWAWNTSSETYVQTSTLSLGTYRETMVDAQNRLWILDSGSQLHVFTPDLPHTVSVVFAENSYAFTGTNIDTNLIVNAYNVGNQRQVRNIQLFIETNNAVFSNNTKTITITTSSSTSTSVPIAITGAGQVRIKTDIVKQ